MQDGLLPLFPLSAVLLPSNQLPLHIFEDRYKEMISHVLDAGSEFGVVLAAQGGIANAGCTASVEEVVKRYEDGRMDIVTAGRRRFTIVSLDQEKSYLRGAVEFFEDGPGSAPIELRREAIRICKEADAQDPAAEMNVAAEPDDPWLSFNLAGSFEDLMFRQQLLTMRSEAGRLRRIIEFAPTYGERRKQVAYIRDVAGQNGHSHHPPEWEQE
ncbi:MAG: ATP-dependent protease La domain-containing protein [Acidobacteria bacterium]|nr:ATP-dependent protease La domain-containing protein [Acidobacteriota bacterium]